MHLNFLTNLEELDLFQNSQLEEADVKPIGALTQLSKLGFSPMSLNKSLNPLHVLSQTIPSLKNLTFLDLREDPSKAYEKKLRDDNSQLLIAIASLPKIQKVYLPSYVSDWDTLAESKSLQTLVVSDKTKKLLFFSTFPEVPDINQVERMCDTLLQKVAKFKQAAVLVTSYQQQAAEFSLLGAAVYAGNHYEMNHFLKYSHVNKTFDPNFAVDGRTPLMHCTAVYAIDALIAAGADMNAQIPSVDDADHINTPLNQLASWSGHLIESLLDHGADPRLGKPSPLTRAIFVCNTPVIERLVEKTAPFVSEIDDTTMLELLKASISRSLARMIRMSVFDYILDLFDRDRIERIVSSNIQLFWTEVAFERYSTLRTVKFLLQFDGVNFDALLPLRDDDGDDEDEKCEPRTLIGYLILHQPLNVIEALMESRKFSNDNLEALKARRECE